MTTEPAEATGQNEIRDGISATDHPIPRDFETPETSDLVPAEPSSKDGPDGPDGPDDASDAGASESASPPGPAEEEDEQVGDDRALTTEANPTD
ncbi:hypothetical protein ACIQC5_12910 [Paenarthrobacter sp. NPDC092416]|uniref:hypothetical protein n=1 Tax=Paenarthrobacter sp. NPDC092416 TaxID=3364386 RepID=UPI00381D1337